MAQTDEDVDPKLQRVLQEMKNYLDDLSRKLETSLDEVRAELIRQTKTLKELVDRVDALEKVLLTVTEKRYQTEEDIRTQEDTRTEENSKTKKDPRTEANIKTEGDVMTEEGDQTQEGVRTGEGIDANRGDQADDGASTPWIPTQEDRNRWRDNVRRWFPDLNTGDHFVPPVHFRRVPFHTIARSGTRIHLICQVKKQNKKKQAKYSGGQDAPDSENPDSGRPHPATVLWTSPRSGDESLTVYNSDVQGDTAEQHVFHCLQKLAKLRNDPMVVLFNLKFGKDPEKEDYAATTVRFHMPSELFKENEKGELDAFIISRKHGLIACEVKSVGAYKEKALELKDVQKKLKKAVKQLDNAQTVIESLFSRLGMKSVNIKKTIAVPYITPEQFKRAAKLEDPENPKLEVALCTCLGVQNLDEAVKRCLCSGGLSSLEEPWTIPRDLEKQLKDWWSAVAASDEADDGQAYEELVALFCGSITVELGIMWPLPLRTEWEGVAAVGMIMSLLKLYPEQEKIVNEALPPKGTAPTHRIVLLNGPPGTGKTVVLARVALRWMEHRHDVYVISTQTGSRGVSFLIQRQLEVSYENLHNFDVDSASEGPQPPKVHRCHFSFDKDGTGAVKAAVAYLAERSLDKKGKLHVILDDAAAGSRSYTDKLVEFCMDLSKRVKELHVWTARIASVDNLYETLQTDESLTGCVQKHTFTLPVRCPPVVTMEVKRSKRIYNESIPQYEVSLAPTHGPEPKTLRHRSQNVGHAEKNAANCEDCGKEIAKEINHLMQGDSDLEFRDCMVLCTTPRDDLGVVRGLRESGLPVKVVEKDDDDDAIRSMALSKENKVIVTDSTSATGLERRIVIVIGKVTVDSTLRLYGISRCSSQLMLVDPPE